MIAHSIDTLSTELVCQLKQLMSEKATKQGASLYKIPLIVPPCAVCGCRVFVAASGECAECAGINIFTRKIYAPRPAALNGMLTTNGLKDAYDRTFVEPNLAVDVSELVTKAESLGFEVHSTKLNATRMLIAEVTHTVTGIKGTTCLKRLQEGARLNIGRGQPICPFRFKARQDALERGDYRFTLPAECAPCPTCGSREVLTERASCHGCQLKSDSKFKTTAKGRQSTNKSATNYRKNNPAYYLARDLLKRLKDGAKTGLKVSKVFDLVGYTSDDLKAHMESLFTEGMSWDNHGAWHIDHIKPVAVFKAEGITDPAIINALSNLQPLWAKDNLSKGSNY